jgi:ketosteroid isomerase-like protein
MKRKTVATICGLGLLGVCAAMAEDKRSTQSGSDADATEILRLTREFVAGFNSGDLDRTMRFYADRYVDVNLRQPVQTKAERREYYRKIVEPRDVTLEVVPEEIIVSGSHAFVRGTIVLRRKVQGAPEPPRELRYIEVWQKFPDGWKSIWGMDAELYPEKR